MTNGDAPGPAVPPREPVMRFRLHRGSLAASMETMRTFRSRVEFLHALRDEMGLWASSSDQEFARNLGFVLYGDGPDTRIGWERTYLVTLSGSPIGFSDGVPGDLPETSTKPTGLAGTPPSRFRCPICDRAGDAYGCAPGRCRARWLAGCNACGDSYQVETRVMADAWFAGHEGSPTCRANRPADPALRSRWRRKSDGVEAWVAKFIGLNLTLLQGDPDGPDPVTGFQVFHETMQTLRDAWEPVS